MHSALNKLLTGLISITIVFIFLLPFSWIFYVGDADANGHWQKMYLLEDWISLMFYLPFVILWAIYLIRTSIFNSFFLKFLLLVAALITFVISLLSAVLPAQDYEPGWGILISLFIFPLLVALLISRNIILKAK